MDPVRINSRGREGVRGIERVASRGEEAEGRGGGIDRSDPLSVEGRCNVSLITACTAWNASFGLIIAAR